MNSPGPPPHPEGDVYDSVFVLSSGRVTSIGPQGEFNWQVCCVVGQYHVSVSGVGSPGGHKGRLGLSV